MMRGIRELRFLNLLSPRSLWSLGPRRSVGHHGRVLIRPRAHASGRLQRRHVRRVQREARRAKTLDRPDMVLTFRL